MASQTLKQAGIIPPAVQALLDFHVRGYYKQTIPENEKSAATRYIVACEMVLDDLKEVVRGLYKEREAAVRRIEAAIKEWDETEASKMSVSSPSLFDDPSEYVGGL